MSICLSSHKLNSRPSLREFIESVPVPNGIGKRPANILLDRRPNGYSQVIETGCRAKGRDLNVPPSDDLKNKMAGGKGAYIQLKVSRGLKGYFRIEGVKSPAARRKEPGKPNANVVGNGQGLRKFAARRSGIKRLVT